MRWVPIHVDSATRGHWTPLAEATRDEVLTYMQGCPVVLAARMRVKDKFDASQRSIPVVFHSDGEWIWSQEAVEYFDRYEMPLPEEFVRRILDAKGNWPTDLSHEVREEVVSAIKAKGSGSAGE